MRGEVAILIVGEGGKLGDSLGAPFRCPPKYTELAFCVFRNILQMCE